MVATRGRTFKRPWRRSCLSSKLKSSSAPIGRKDSWCFHAAGSSNAPLLGSTAAEGLPRIGRTSIATRWRSCGLPQSASCSENFVILPDVFGQTLRGADLTGCRIYGVSAWGLNLEGAKQQSLIITKLAENEPEPEITVDNLEVAQFIYLLLHNEKIRDVIDTITSKVVLILGRFTPERKAILDAIRDEL